MKFSSSDIAAIAKGELTGPGDILIDDVITDSRQLNLSEELLFIAIRGKNHDGHDYVESLCRKGIKAFIVEQLPDNYLSFPDAAFISVISSVDALQSLATHQRMMFKSPVIAVTGSAGKTVVKEWLADIAGLTMSVVRSPKSYNSQIGVPLSVLKLDDKYAIGIFEAGISMPGEMEKLQMIIKPDVGVITNIGDAHSENFANNAEKAEEKLKLFSQASMIVYCSDQTVVHQQIMNSKMVSSRRLIGWSVMNREAEVFAEVVSNERGGTFLGMSFSGKYYQFEIPFNDRASVDNAITVATVCLAIDIQAESIKSGLKGLVSVAMRMEKKSGINNCQLIEDYYNSDPGSLVMALDYLKLQGSSKMALILSDFVQSGRNEQELYTEVATTLEKTGIIRLIGIGEALVRNNRLFRPGSKFYATTDDFIRGFNGSEFRDEVILLKGARIYEFEKIGTLLERQTHQTVLEISLDAVAHNLNEFRRFLNPSTRIMAMVKAFAYGAGPAEISALLEYHRAGYLAVAYANEGVELRNAGVSLPVMVMNPDPSADEKMIKYNLEPEIYSFSSLTRFKGVASRHGLINYPVHIKVDTGMHRLGFMPGEVAVLATQLSESECIRVVSVFSHLSASEDPELDYFTHRQAEVFLDASRLISTKLGYPVLRHLLNSAGIVRFPQYQFDMVRPGIGIYGASHFENLTLKPVGRFKTRISQLKKIPSGEPVGYGCADVSGSDRIIAILPVGYADGLNRKLGNRNGSLFIKGSRVPLTGNICMDMCMADVTGIVAEEGDEAEIFGERIPIEEVASKCGTITYEILTSIPPRVKRIFFTA